MNRNLVYPCLAVLAALLSSCATDTASGNSGGASVEVNFESPERFTDMSRIFAGPRGADEGYLNELRKYLQTEGADRLPAGYNLSVTVTDVDMAGDFEPQRGADFSDIRVVKQIYPPRIDLRYRLTGPDGAVRAESERRLRNTDFGLTIRSINRDYPLRHEKALIDDFLRDLRKQI